jgi:glycosyltransferase involved in cell wall biosynthesis
LLGDGCDQKTQLVLLPLDTTLGVIPAAEAESRIAELNPALNAAPFILHVGSSHKRKNRDGVLRVFSELKDRFDGPLVFAGAPLTDELRQLANSYGIADRIIEILRPSDSLLEALYNRAHALLFPSRFEGFGWPLIEAQACGCPVVCSDAGPFGELMQDTALVTPVDDIQAFANNLLMLNDLEIRRQYSNRGLENVKRFLPEIAAKGYLRIYQELLQKSVPEAITVQ